MEHDLETLRHSSAHVLAQAVLSLFPDAKLGIGPAIEEGFYYDFDLPRSLTPEDLQEIEKRMNAIVAADHLIVREELPREEAIRFFRQLGQDYKVELIADMPPDETISIYRQDAFVDLCRGPHLVSTGKLGRFKLLSVAGAYWRGDEQRPMLQRIYGTVFPTQGELDAYLHRLEEAARRDHRKLGRELDLFSIHEEAGAGLIFWHPRGAMIRKLMEDLWREQHLQHGYELIYTPHLAKQDLWEISGHLGFYRDNMYGPVEVEGQEYRIKPMNCPFHILIYKSRLRSYRELPIRWAELGTVYRFERSGVLHGLLRVRGFTQDDAHLFCRPDQLEEEIVGVINFVLSMLRTFGFQEYEIYLSTRPDKFVGTPESWDVATAALEEALRRVGLPYAIDPGEGVFYGPKIDLKIRDAIGRSWQCTTIQVDFNLPERFDMTYVAEDGKEKRPIMIHRALLGSLERFFGVLIEHYAGAFPVWLAPVQAIILPIADRHLEYATSVQRELAAAGLRVSVDARSERVNLKIREAQLQKIPYMLVVGDQELQQGAVSTRLRSGENRGAMPLPEFLQLAQQAISERC